MLRTQLKAAYVCSSKLFKIREYHLHKAGIAVYSLLPITMDSAEVEKFKSLVDVWWDLGSPAKYLHSMNKLRIPFLIDSLKSLGALKLNVGDTEKPLKDLAILDVGCGCKSYIYVCTYACIIVIKYL